MRGSKLCHPGHGLQSHWTEVLANVCNVNFVKKNINFIFYLQYFEATIVPRQCNEGMSLAESRIKASAEFFGPSCKAGPWVPDAVQDQILSKFSGFIVFKNLVYRFSTERRYPSLCQLCYNPRTCGMGDKHWGRRGPLYCLSGGYGDVAWVRLDDAMSHFGVSITCKFNLRLHTHNSCKTCSLVAFLLRLIHRRIVFCVRMVIYSHSLRKLHVFGCQNHGQLLQPNAIMLKRSRQCCKVLHMI